MLATLAWGYLLPRANHNFEPEELEEVESVNPYEHHAALDSLFHFVTTMSDTITFPAFEQPPEMTAPVRSEVIYEMQAVYGTIYNAVEGQTDSTPEELASGVIIDLDKAGSYRYCALSRNLLKRWGGKWDYGDTIYVAGADTLSGIWIVHDSMNARHINCIDLLVDLGTHHHTFENATIRKES